MVTTERMVKLVSMDSGTVCLYEPAYNVNKVFKGRGTTQILPFEVISQMLNTDGFRSMIDMGILYIENMQDKIDLGLEEPGTTEPTNIKVLTDAQKATLLKADTVDEFVKHLDGYTTEQVLSLVDYAVENKITNIEKANVLKELTGKDIISIIAKRRAEEEHDKEVARREAEAERAAEGEFTRR